MKDKDWSGNNKANIATLATSNNSDIERHEHDFYATDPIAINFLFDEIKELKGDYILEPCSGQGHLVQAMRNYNCIVQAQDLYNYDNMLINDCITGINFLSFNSRDCLDLVIFDYNIVTNPPYRYAEEFIRHSLEIVNNSKYVCMFLPIRYLEGKKRRKLFDTFPLYKLIVSSSRIGCALNGKFKEHSNSAQGYAWFVWQKGYTGNSIIKWGN